MKRLLLLGGGHAHVQVLDDLARRARPCSSTRPRAAARAGGASSCASSAPALPASSWPSRSATGAGAPHWPAAAGLATDERGCIRVAATLQSISHANVFAAGDVAAYADPRPKSGVYAVRAGPVLGANLRAYCLGQGALRRWTPQADALYLINTGDRHAIAMRGGWSCSGHWVWRWKDGIDRRFMRRYGTAA